MKQPIGGLMEKLTGTTWVPIGLASAVMVAALSLAASLANDRQAALSRISSLETYVSEQKRLNQKLVEGLDAINRSVLRLEVLIQKESNP